MLYVEYKAIIFFIRLIGISKYNNENDENDENFDTIWLNI